MIHICSYIYIYVNILGYNTSLYFIKQYNEHNSYMMRYFKDTRNRTKINTLNTSLL